MNKRRLHHAFKHFRRIKPTFFLVIAVIAVASAVFSLRANNQRMVELRQAVYTADEQSGDVQKALKDLQVYVTSHMNTNLSAGTTQVYPPIQLKFTYDRLVRAQGEATAQANTQLYTAAQAACEQQNSTDVSGRNRVPCIEKYVQEHTTAETKQIPDALYKFAFASPSWSPDLAGWSIVVAILSGILFIFSFALNRFLK